jgi:general secretion pathway protein B
MSIILDALKKSESDQQRQSGPALFEVKVAPPKARLPMWAIAVIALLVINMFIVGYLLLRRPSHADATASAQAPLPPQAQIQYSQAPGQPSQPAAGLSQPSQFGQPGSAPQNQFAQQGSAQQNPYPQQGPAQQNQFSQGPGQPGQLAPGVNQPNQLSPGASQQNQFGQQGSTQQSPYPQQGATQQNQFPQGPGQPGQYPPGPGQQNQFQSQFAPPPNQPGAGVSEANTNEPTLARHAREALNSEPTANPDDYSPATEPESSSLFKGHVKRGTESGLVLYQDAAVVPGANLPQLRLDLHVYAANPQDRFALINMHKLHEGDSLPGGVRVESITTDGVVMSHNGSKFLLPRE